uniref:Uncharacterized protein n=1 Tax=Ciona savignyi TaxID=51511 RepID=H2ZP08_CIOSA
MPRQSVKYKRVYYSSLSSSHIASQDPATYDEGFQSTRQDNAAGERTTDSGVSFHRHRPTTDVVEYRNQSSPAAQQQNGCMGSNCEMKLNQLIKDCNELKQEVHEFRSAPPPPDYGPQIKELVKDVKELKTRMIVVEGDVKELKSKDCCRGSAHCNSTPSTSQAAASQSTGSTHHGTERVIITPSPTVVVIQDPSATVVTQQSHASSSTSPCSTPSCSRPSCSIYQPNITLPLEQPR